MNTIDKPAAIKKIHQKQILWQIWVPLIASLLIVLFLGIMAILLTTRDVSGDFNTKWASISVVFLSLPALSAAFVFLVILCGLIYVLTIALHKTPVIGQRVFEFMQKVQGFIHQLSDRAAEPVIGIKSKWHGFSRIIRKKSS